MTTTDAAPATTDPAPPTSLPKVVPPLHAVSVDLTETAPGTPTLLPTLPGSAYTDPGLFDREVERIVGARWMCAVRADDLPEVGSYRTITIGRESVVLDGYDVASLAPGRRVT